jgi:hypothetical protein
MHNFLINWLSSVHQWNALKGNALRKEHAVVVDGLEHAKSGPESAKQPIELRPRATTGGRLAQVWDRKRWPMYLCTMIINLNFFTRKFVKFCKIISEEKLANFVNNQ